VAPVVDVAVQDVIEAGKGSLRPFGATTQTSVLDAPWWPESGKGAKRLGYLRHGAIVSGYEHRVVNEDCKEGWVELSPIGYVCGKALASELTSPKIRLAPKQPDRDAGMPYRYGVNVQDGTPLYRRVLSMDDRKKYEPWLVPAKAAEDDGEGGEAIEKGESSEPEENARPARKASAFADAGPDGGRPKLKALKGRGVLVRSMARGFYLALDRAFNAGGARWWRTSFGFAVPFERIMLQSGVTKHAGAWFEAVPVESDETDAGTFADADAADAEAGAPRMTPTVGFVKVGYARKLNVTDDQKKVTWGPELPKRSAVLLDGRTATVTGVTYHHTSAGFWVRMMDLMLAQPSSPADLRPDEKWIDVDLTRQALVAFEGTRAVFATLISSGRRNPEDKEHDFPTPTGSFRIREKHVTTTMDGDVASDGPYSIEDVPWVMYFQGSYAFHGAFWHDAFGNKRSHGCVNMAPDDARTLFGWVDPVLPEGWHGAFSSDDNAGTRVVVHEDPPPKRHP
jgi:lipoprotein-anchoring transpeptidase ErfK/SrfK